MSLPVELRDDFAHGLGSTGGCWNDVLVGAAAITPGLSAGAIHCLLGGCVCMDCGLQGGESYSMKQGSIFKKSSLLTAYKSFSFTFGRIYCDVP